MKDFIISILWAIASSSFLLFPSLVFAGTVSDLNDMPLESLMELKVTSVSKKSQSLTNAAAAVFVITQEDIKRSGVTTIVDALRMVPGIQVAKIDSNKWAVSSRGHNGRFANKLLVLMDGRSLYTPYFIGVYWEVQDTLLEDIDRIEVIKGPGAALWGANAVNGVINIITRSAENSKGSLVSIGGGNYEKIFLAARNGTSLGEDSDIRIYAKHQERGSFTDNTGAASNDAWKISQGGFRLDSRPTPRDTVTLQGDYYEGGLNETFHLYNLTPPDYQQLAESRTSISGGNITARWQRDYAENSRLSLQLYYDYSERDMLVSPQRFNTYDLEFQHRFGSLKFQDVVWGGGYRHNQYSVVNTPTILFNETNVTNSLFSAFVHDEIAIAADKLFLIVGSRFERSDVAGFNIQPNCRLLWATTAHTSLWGSVSRAVRSKTKGEQDITYNYRTIAPQTDQNRSLLPLRLEIVGNRDFKSEEMIGYEIGARTELIQRLFTDIALYYNRYTNLRVISPGTPYTEPASGAPANAVQPYYLSNDMHGNAIGAELAIDYTPLDWWRLQAAYCYQKLAMDLDGTSQDSINKGNAEGDTPLHQLSLRSGFDLGRQVKLDLWLRGTDRLASIDGISIPGYFTTDVRLAWKPAKNLELTIVGQNLLHNHRKEFVPEYINTVPSDVVRSAYGKVAWKF